MAGDTVRDAFRAELDAVIAAASPPIAWTRIDTLNTPTNPAPNEPHFDLEFGQGSEAQYTFGSPGNNFHRESAPVFVHVRAPLAQSLEIREQAETYAAQVRTAFRGRRFAAGVGTIRIVGAAPMGAGQVAGGMWVETVALQYVVLNLG